MVRRGAFYNKVLKYLDFMVRRGAFYNTVLK